MANTIADKLTYLNGTKTAIRDAIVAKGVEVPDDATFRSYAQKIGEISGGSAPDTKLGISIDGLIGDVSSTGAYVSPSTEFTPDFTGINSFTNYQMMYKFAKCRLVGDIVIGASVIGNYTFNGLCYYAEGDFNVSIPNIEEPTYSAGDSFRYSFSYSKIKNLSCGLKALPKTWGYSFGDVASNSTLESADFGDLETVEGNYAFQNAFSGCASLINMNFEKLRVVDGISAFSNAFSSMNTNSNLTPNIEEIKGSSCFSNAYSSQKNLESIEFGKLKIISGSSALSYCFF